MLKIERLISFGLIFALSVFAVLNWRKAKLFEAENERLNARLAAAETDLPADPGVSGQEVEELRKRSAELMKLRNEITQIRASAQHTQNLAAENQRLKADLASARGNAAAAATGSAGGSQSASADQIPRESWRFAGYGSPESALISAIWSMKDGSPQNYLDSLAPAEQQRTSERWQTMSQDQVMAKHRSDVANITGLRILQRDALAPDEVVMNVFLEGPGRVEKVRLNQVGQDWKFSGFVRDPQPQPVQAPAAPQ